MQRGDLDVCGECVGVSQTAQVVMTRLRPLLCRFKTLASCKRKLECQDCSHVKPLPLAHQSEIGRAVLHPHQVPTLSPGRRLTWPLLDNTDPGRPSTARLTTLLAVLRASNA